MQVTNRSLAIHAAVSRQQGATADTNVVPFNQVFEEIASKQSRAQEPQMAGTSNAPALKARAQPLCSIAEHAPPGSDMPPGFSEALYSLMNQPGLTNEERSELFEYVCLGLACAKHCPPEMAAKFPGFEGVGTADFNPVHALLTAVNVLGSRYPNLAKIGNAWAAAQGESSARIAGA